MSKKRKKKKKHIDPYDVLEGRVNVTSHELVRLIHRVNPTKEGTGAKEQSERYKVKARLQSLLIRKFYDGLLVEPPDPGNPQMVGLKLRYFDEDACHALLPELDPDARSWAQRQIDEAESGGDAETGEPTAHGLRRQSFDGPDAPGNIHENGTAAGKEEYSQKELIHLGRRALEEYDYDTCEDYFYRAFVMSRGGIDAALTILEFFIDHLAAYEKASALADSLSANAKKDENVRVLLALAAARRGNIDHALDFLGRTLHPRAADVYLLGAKHFVSRGNTQRAKELLAVLKSFEPNLLQPEIMQLEKDIQRLRIESLEPVEQEMLLAWQRGEQEQAVKLAEQLLGEWPQNKEARRICNEFAWQRQTARLNSLLRRAEEANAKGEFIEEAELLKKALELSKDDHELDRRFKLARQAAELQRCKAEIEETIKLRADGRNKEALLRFVALTGKQRREIMNSGDLYFSWLSRIIAAQSSLKPEKMVEAVLALGESKEILRKGGDPRPVVAAMQHHGKVLRAVPAARDILLRAQEMAKVLESEKTKELLKKAGDLAAAEDFQTAHECLDQVKADLLDEDDRKILADINATVNRLEPVRAMEKKYAGEAARGNHFSSRDIALKLAGLAGPDNAAHWRRKAAHHSAQIKKEWSFVTGNIEDLHPSYHSPAAEKITDTCNNCLLPDGRHIILVSNHDRWVFLRTFCLQQQKFKQAAIFRAPAGMPYPHIYLAGNEIWVTGSKGHVVSLSLEPPEILSWHDFSDFVKNDDIVEDVYIFPKRGYLWLNTRERESRGDETCEVINIEQWRVDRRFKLKSHPIIINTGGGYRIAVQDYLTKNIHLISEQGKTIDTFALATKGSVNAGTGHPNGKDYVFLPFIDSENPAYQELAPGEEYEENNDFLLTVETAPDVEKKDRPFIIDDSHGELMHSIYTALDDGLIFISFFNDSTEENCYNLAALTPGEHGFEELYRVEFQGKLLLGTDELSRKVVVINSGAGEIRAEILGRDKPLFAGSIVPPGLKLSFPSFDGFMSCYAPTGAVNATKLAFVAQIQNSTLSQFDELLLKMRQPDKDGPDKIAAFIYALEHLMYFDLAREMKTWFKKKYPGHPMALIGLATGAVDKRKWRGVISLLEKVSLDGLDDGTACHICHLLGMGLFAEGDIKRALATWKQGDAYERGHCRLAPYIAYARASLMKPKQRKKKIAKNDILKTLNFFERVDAHLADREWTEAVSLMETYNVPSSYELQTLARFAEAFLHRHVVPGEPGWFCKVAALATYCEKNRDESLNQNHVLPPDIEHWSGQRLNDIANRADQWLESQSAPLENGT